MTAAAMTDDKTLERVRKLLAKAEDPSCTAEEAEAFNAKASELIAKYGIEHAMLVSRPGQVGEKVLDRMITLPAPYSWEKAELLASVATPLGVRFVRYSGYGVGSTTRVHLIGFESDLERVNLLFTSLLMQASTGVMKAVAPAWERLATFRSEWYSGFSYAVRYRLKEAEKAAKAEFQQTTGVSTELVLRDRLALVKGRQDELFPSLGRGRARNLRGQGSDAGYREGSKADIGFTRLGGGARPISS